MFGRWRCIAWIALSILIAHTSPCSASASGTYVGRDADVVAMLQLVEAPGGQVSGQFTVVAIDTHGKITDGNASVTGVTDGQAITLQIRPISFLSFATNYSGKVDGNHIELNGSAEGGQLNTLALARGKVSDFRAYSEEFRTRSRDIVQTRKAAEQQAKLEAARREFQTRIDDLISRMQKFRSDVSVNIERYPQAEARYRSTTTRMQSHLDRERKLAGDSRAAVTRSQIAATISKGEVVMDQAHVGFEAVNAPLLQENRVIRAKLEGGERECHRAQTAATSAEPISAEQTPTNPICLKLGEEAKAYRASVELIGKAFNQAEAAYAAEHRKQSAILNEANRLSP